MTSSLGSSLMFDRKLDGYLVSSLSLVSTSVYYPSSEEVGVIVMREVTLCRGHMTSSLEFSRLI